MILHDCEQNSPEWFEARRGLVTASEFATILAKGKDGKSPSLTRAKYLRRLAGERLTGECVEGWSNADTDRGHVMEPQARTAYQIERGEIVRRVGFATNDAKTAGSSPDGLIGDHGAVEFKSATPHVLLEHIERAIDDPLYFPSEHYAQCQGNIWVCEREWLDLVIFWPKLPLFIRRLYRDETYIGALDRAVANANNEILLIMERVGSYVPEAA